MTETRQKSFQQWMQQVDRVLARKCGLSHMDLADQCWYDWFDSDMTPKEAAQECLDDEGFPSEE